MASWADRDTAFDDVASAIERIIEELQEQRRRAAEQTLRRIPKPLPVPTLFIDPSDISGVTEIRWYRVPGVSEYVLERIESLRPFTTVEVYRGKPADKEIEWLCFHLQRHSTLLALDKPGEGCSHRVKAIAGPGDLNSDWSSWEDELGIFKCCRLAMPTLIREDWGFNWSCVPGATEYVLAKSSRYYKREFEMDYTQVYRGNETLFLFDDFYYPWETPLCLSEGNAHTCRVKAIAGPGSRTEASPSLGLSDSAWSNSATL